MKISVNPNEEIANLVKEGLKKAGGLLPLPPGTNGGYKVHMPGVSGADRRP